ncbi:MAG: RDD family protein [Planctomycetaceae bacterium]
MSIRIRCTCTWEGNINDSLAGKKVRCPDCRGTIQVPRSEEQFKSRPSVTAAPATSPPPETPPRVPAAASPPPVAPPRAPVVTSPPPAAPPRAPVAASPPPVSPPRAPAATSPPPAAPPRAPVATSPPPAAPPRVPVAASPPPVVVVPSAKPLSAAAALGAALAAPFNAPASNSPTAAHYSGTPSPQTRPVPPPNKIFDTWDAEIPVEEDIEGSKAENPFGTQLPGNKAVGKNRGALPEPFEPWRPGTAPRQNRLFQTTVEATAGRFTRLATKAVELLVLLAFMLPGYLLFANTTWAPEYDIVRRSAYGLFIAAFVIHIVVTLILCCSGKTIGKKIFRLTVHDRSTGMPAGALRTSSREILYEVAFLMVFFLVDHRLAILIRLIDVLFIFSSDRRRLTDRICNTVVVAD